MTLHGCHHGGIYSAANPENVKIDFSSNINPLGISNKVISKLKENIGLAYNYPDPKCINLKQSIVQYGLCDNRFDIDENIIIGNGATELIHYFADAFASGKKVGIPIPTFCEYELAVKRKGAKIKYFFPHKKDSSFLIDQDSILRTVNNSNNDISCLFLCNPNNPTGRYFEREILEIIEKTNKKTKILLDESFLEFVNKNMKKTNKNNNLFVNLTKDYNNLVILRSLTKIYGLAGLRVGYIVSSKPVIEKLHNKLVSWNVNGLAQFAAIEALKDKSHLRRTISNIDTEREHLFKLLNKIKKLRVIPTNSNFYLIEILDKISSTELCNMLFEKYRILVRDCASFTGMNNKYIRISIRSRKENDMLLNALEGSFEI